MHAAAAAGGGAAAARASLELLEAMVTEFGVNTASPLGLLPPRGLDGAAGAGAARGWVGWEGGYAGALPRCGLGGAGGAGAAHRCTGWNGGCIGWDALGGMLSALGGMVAALGGMVAAWARKAVSTTWP
eukprot:165884-Chlamydomonas_euryale.AAC.1